MDVNSITSLVNSLFPESWAGMIFAVIGVFAAVAVFLPAPGADSGTVYRFVYSVFNWLGCNWGKAKNADDAQKVLYVGKN